MISIMIGCWGKKEAKKKQIFSPFEIVRGFWNKMYSFVMNFSGFIWTNVFPTHIFSDKNMGVFSGITFQKNKEWDHIFFKWNICNLYIQCQIFWNKVFNFFFNSPRLIASLALSTNWILHPLIHFEKVYSRTMNSYITSSD